ncbi:MAG: glycerol acyltransferase [Bacteroidota bacterium]
MTDSLLSFEEIRPYYDHEVPAVLQRFIEKPSFFLMMGVLFPELKQEDIIKDLQQIKTVEEFQAGYIHETIVRIVGMSCQELTISGLDKLNKGDSYLFLSNHRDIILDSAFLNVKLHEEGFGTSRIAIGDNLMVSNLITDLMKINKSFIVHRSVPRQELMAHSERLSKYIRFSIHEEHSSVWLAQRSGRTKDGLDLTSPAILKMLNIANGEDMVQGFKGLNIVPMSISYEYEPCDSLKVEERYHKLKDLPYEKDDKVAMVTGIRAPKGRVHLALGEPMKESIAALPAEKRKNDWLKNLGELIDQQIHALYNLWPTNYIASDLLSGSNEHESKYTADEKQSFLTIMEERLADIKGEAEALRQLYLEMYAAMVGAKLAPAG